MVQLITLSTDDLKDIIRTSVSEALKDNQTPQPSTPKDQPEYLTRRQAANVLHLSLTTLDTYTRIGILKAKKVGHRVLYRASDINDSLSGKTTIPKPKRR